MLYACIWPVWFALTVCTICEGIPSLIYHSGAVN